MKTTTAFAALEAGRRARSEASRPWAIRAVNKDGSVRKGAPMDRCASEAAASERVAYLESVNPGKRFVAVNEVAS